ncbi:hypothetical protein DPMN_086705 [Dreissena polymorpha]|uniref:Uncharacterized protein n=1 Tax=Dreissena polymorpha TaxID=45954 RepID=A0A9D4KQY3_DREPO|nr:hypothetical protein DPMN_086705 [Dreissena polymorpha]
MIGPKLKTALPTGGHTTLHEDWVLNVTFKIFKLDRDIIGTNLLTKFHEDLTINVASTVFTNKCGRTDRRWTNPVTKAHLTDGQTTDKDQSQKLTLAIRKTAPYPWQIFLTKFHENWAKNVTSRVLTCFYYIHIEKNAPPTLQPCLKTAPPTGGHTIILTNFELDRDFIGTKLLTKFHDNLTINVASRVFTNKC